MRSNSEDMGNLDCERGVGDDDGRCKGEFKNSTPVLSDLVRASSIIMGARHDDLHCL